MNNKHFSRFFMLLMIGLLAGTLMLLAGGENLKQAAYTRMADEANRAAADRQKISGETSRKEEPETDLSGPDTGNRDDSGKISADNDPEDKHSADNKLSDEKTEKNASGEKTAEEKNSDDKSTDDKSTDEKSTDSGSSSEEPAEDSQKKKDSWNKETAGEKLEEIFGSELTDKKVMLDVPEIFQNPELPTGCESVALTIDLSALGCEIGKTDIAKDYLVKGTDLATSYVGDPFSEGGAGTFPPGLVRTAKAYLRKNAQDIFAFDTSGTDLEDLYKVIQAGWPVIVWTTMFMDEPLFINNEGEYQWFRNEHCVLLYGYDLKKGVVEISDPLEGLVTRKADDFAEIFEATGKCSVVLLNEAGVNRNDKQG